MRLARLLLALAVIASSTRADGYPTRPANAAQLQGKSISSTAPVNGQVLRYGSSSWQPANDAHLTTITVDTPAAGTSASNIAITGVAGAAGVVGVAAKGSITFIATDSYHVGDTVTGCDNSTPQRCVTFRFTATGGQWGSSGLNCSSWPCTYTLPIIGLGATAHDTAGCFANGILGQDGASCLMAVPVSGLGITGVVGDATLCGSDDTCVGFTDSATGAGGNTLITDSGISGVSHTGMSGGVTAVTAGNGSSVAISSGAGGANGGSAGNATITIAGSTEVTVATTGVTLNHALPVASGGTGATAASDARTNLGILSGTVGLTGGSATVSAAITANSRIIVTYKNQSNNVELSVPQASRNVGAGTFVITNNTGTDNSSTVDWIAIQ